MRRMLAITLLLPLVVLAQSGKRSSASASASAVIVNDVGGVRPDGGVLGTPHIEVVDGGTTIHYE